MGWEQNQEFVAWLDAEGLGTEDEPLHEETLDLMHQAWVASRKTSSPSSRWAVRIWQSNDFGPHWRACLTHNDMIVGQWGAATQSANNHMLILYASQQEIARNIAVSVLTMLQNFDRELWRVAPPLDEVKAMVIEAGAEMFEALGLSR